MADEHLLTHRVRLGPAYPVLVLQPVRSRLCGHACVATLVDQPLSVVVQEIGHERGTRTRELLAALELWGLVPKSAARLKRVARDGLVPTDVRGLANVRWYRADGAPKLASGGHWCVAWDGDLLDPEYGLRTRADRYSFASPWNMRVTSYLALTSSV